jgi:hypothetical protein
VSESRRADRHGEFSKKHQRLKPRADAANCAPPKKRYPLWLL